MSIEAWNAHIADETERRYETRAEYFAARISVIREYKRKHALKSVTDAELDMLLEPIPGRAPKRPFRRPREPRRRREPRSPA